MCYIVETGVLESPVYTVKGTFGVCPNSRIHYSLCSLYEQAHVLNTAQQSDISEYCIETAEKEVQDTSSRG